jgi:hypothetical protein
MALGRRIIKIKRNFKEIGVRVWDGLSWRRIKFSTIFVDKIQNVRLEIFTEVTVKNVVNRRFGGTCRLHLLTLVPRSRICLPLRWRRYAPPKRRSTHDLHSATTQKTTFFKLQNVVRYDVSTEQMDSPISLECNAL